MTDEQNSWPKWFSQRKRRHAATLVHIRKKVKSEQLRLLTKKKGKFVTRGA